jgi:D-aminopeptidase
VRTGVTVIQPRQEAAWENPCFAGCHRLNGAGELTGLEWVRESGLLTTPIGLTNTHSVGVVRDALVKDAVRERRGDPGFWVVPVVGETYDGLLTTPTAFMCVMSMCFRRWPARGAVPWMRATWAAVLA